MNLVERYYYGRAQESVKQEMFFLKYIDSCEALTELERGWIVKTYFGKEDTYPPTFRRIFYPLEHAEGNATYFERPIAQDILPDGAHADYF